jgi:hypothetical protein
VSAWYRFGMSERAIAAKAGVHPSPGENIL